MRSLLLLSSSLAYAAGAHTPPPPLPILFVDDAQIARWDDALVQTVHAPVRGPRVVWPDRPWESWAVFAYNHVLEVPAALRRGSQTQRRGVAATAAAARYRLYYDCIEGTGLPPGNTNDDDDDDDNNNNNNNNVGALSHRRICLAVSDDGLAWSKPDLGIFNRNSTKGWSKHNNILLEDSGVSVFIDRSPAAVASGNVWKMVCSTSAYESADGLVWSPLPFAPIATDDTKPTAHWDGTLEKYVISVRRDIAPHWFRTIGRCETTNLSDWQSEVVNETGCPVVFSPDDKDPPNVDCYTNAWTPYPSPEHPVVHLYFPSMYAHFGENPYGFGNDGLLDIRLLVSRDGKKLDYVGPRAAAARAPFVNLGLNKCGPYASAPSVADGWCSPTSGIEAKTHFDTSATYMASGHLLSPDGASLLFYASGQPFTHGGDSANQTWKNNTGIRVLQLRKDGFASVDAPYDFSGGSNNSLFPSLTTTEVNVPAGCPVPQKVALGVNLVTSVVGFAAVGVVQNGQEVPGYGLADADRLKGNAISAAASWGAGTKRSLSAFVGQQVAFKVAMADTKLYSLTLICV